MAAAMLAATTTTSTNSTTATTMTSATTFSQPLLDENAIHAASDAAVAAVTGVKKFYVPSSDRRLVLSAIDNQINLAKDTWGEKNFNSCNDNDNTNTTTTINLAAKGEFFLDCINQTGASLHRQLELVTTTPADETEVESMLDSFRTRLAIAILRNSRTTTTSDKHGDANNDDDDDDDDELSSSSDDDTNDQEFEFDDAEIVDSEAYQQVKQLREQARTIASRVVSVRNETVGRAMTMTQRNLVELMRVHGFDNESDDNTSQEDGEQQHHQTEEEKNNNNNNNNPSGSSDQLNPLRMALQTLATSLAHVDSTLGENLGSLKETIGTIDSSVMKIQRHLKGDESALSRTEKALLASSNSGNSEEDTVEVVAMLGEGGRRRADAESNDVEDEITTESVMKMNPDKKLAHLLAGIL